MRVGDRVEIINPYGPYETFIGGWGYHPGRDGEEASRYRQVRAGSVGTIVSLYIDRRFFSGGRGCAIRMDSGELFFTSTNTVRPYSEVTPSPTGTEEDTSTSVGRLFSDILPPPSVPFVEWEVDDLINYLTEGFTPSRR